MPTVSTTPAMPGNVSVVPMEHIRPGRMMIFVVKGDLRHDARQQIITKHERGNKDDAGITDARMPLRIESRPSVGSTSLE